MIRRVFSYFIATEPHRPHISSIQYTVLQNFPTIPSELFFSQTPSLGSLKVFSICFRSESQPFRSEFVFDCALNRTAGHSVIGVYF